MSDLVETRTAIVLALEAVLPGRVYAHPPTSGRAVTPSIFVEQDTADPFIDEVVVTFPVWVVADGAIEAQVQAHAGIVWNAMLALYPLGHRVGWRPVQVAGLRATVIEVDVLIDAFGLCGAPEPVAYTYSTR